jgi:hypothetical protein
MIMQVGRGEAPRDEEDQMDTAQNRSMTMWWRCIAALCIMATFLVAPAALRHSGAHAAPVPIGHPGSGFLSNFDVSNDTGVYCAGFDIQIEDVGVSDAPYQYWGTYGQPTVTPMTFTDGHTGIDVRYAATFASGTYSASTPPGAMDHFGVSVNVPPGNQNLTWLCDSSASAADPGSSGNLVATGGTATGNGYTNNTITNPVPQVTTAIVPTAAGEQVRQQVVNQIPASAAPGVQGDAVWFYRHPSMTLTDPLALIDLTPEFPAVAAMTQHQANDLMNLVDAGGSESASTQTQNGTGSVVWVVDTYAYADPTTGAAGPYDDAHTALCNETPNDPNNCANFVGALLSTTVLSTNLANGGNRSPVNVAETVDGSASTVGGTVTSNDIAAAGVNANPGNIDCGAGSTTCTSVVDDNTPVTLTAVPAAGFNFAGWNVAGPGLSGLKGAQLAAATCTNSASTCTVTASARRNVTARFVHTMVVNPPASVPHIVAGTSAKITLTASGIKTGATASASGSGVIISGLTQKTAKATGLTTLKFTATVASSASSASHDLIVTNSDSSSATCIGCLSVTALPSVTSRSPNHLAHPASGSLTSAVVLLGSGFEAGAKVTSANPGMTVKVTSVDSSTQITLSVKLTSAATAGAKMITLKNPDKGATSFTLTVT